MKQATSALVILLVMGIALPAFGRPETRYDATTKTCRTLDHGPLEWESRAWGQGGKVFRSLCQGCHFRDNDQGAPFLWAESKTAKAWNRVFSQKYPPCAQDGSWDSMTLDEQLMVNDYLFRWGKNSRDVNDNA